MRQRVWQGLSLLVWAVAAAVLAQSLTVVGAIWAAAIGAAVGVVASAWVAPSRLRLHTMWGAAVGIFALIWLTARTMRDTEWLASLVGPTRLYSLAEMVLWGLGCLVVVALLRASTSRDRLFVLLEVGLVGGIFSGLFAPHRDGLINRPFFLVDPLWAKGYDPLPIFLLLGAVIGAVLLVLSTSTSSSKRRSWADLVLLLGLVVLIFVLLPVQKLKDLPALQDAMGNKQDQKDREKGQGGSPTPGESGDPFNPTPDPSASPDASHRLENDLDFKDWQNMRSQVNQPLAVVLLHDDYEPSVGFYYFRQNAFSQYNGQKLVHDTTGRADRDLAEYYPTVPITMEGGPFNDRTIRSLDTSVALLANLPRPFALVNGTAMEPLQNPDEKRFQRAYRVTSQVMTGDLSTIFGRTIGDSTWDRELWNHYTEAPADPRYKELAQKCLEEIKPEYRQDPVAQAAAIKIWLDRNTVYSLDSKYENDPDPVGAFLFGDRTGYCVYLAHSAVYLFRSMGIPARVGAGFAVSARNRAGGSSLVLRQGDSHAWPEVYLQGLGWVVIDISPEKSLVPPGDPPDPGMQQMLGEMARQDPNKAQQKPAGDGDIQEAIKRLLRAMAELIGPLLLGAMIALYLYKIWRRIEPYYAPAHRVPRLAYRAALDRLADGGRLRAFGQTRESFAEEVRGICPSLTPLTAMHLQDALGRPADVPERQRYISLYESASREVIANVPFWRLVLGAINPISWYFVK